MDIFNFKLLRLSDKEALSTNNIKLSFKQLFKTVDNIEKKFLELQIEKGDRVAVCMENSIEMVACVIACLELKVVLIPIDINSSLSRINAIINECLPKVIVLKLDSDSIKLTLSKLIKKEIKDSKSRLVFLEMNSVKNIQSPADSIYIIYTSGSTGTPKGVTIGYTSLCVHTKNMLSIWEFKDDTKILVTSTFSFDAALGYIYYSLASGASIHIFDNKLLLPRRIVGCINEYKISHYACTPSFLVKIIQYINYDCSKISSIKTLSFGAENIKDYEIRVINKFKRENMSIRIFNRYGPTEATIASSVYEICNYDKEYIPIGSPLPGVEYYIKYTDYNRQIGELYIGGQQNMLGYFNDSTLTEQAFEVIEGTKMYRTNDIVKKINTDIVFVDRNDGMLKRDGKRIYLSEIENIVSNMKNVLDSTVTIKSKNPLLVVAYVVADHIQVSEIEDELKKEYPHYMIPDKIYIVDKIPRNNNSKIDKSMLTIREGRN